LWIRDRKCKFVNIVNAVVLWSLWRTRNNMCFQDSRWPGTRRILEFCARSIRSWSLLVQEPEVLEGWAMELAGRSVPLQLAWSTHQESGPSSSEREIDQDVIASDPLVFADSVVLNVSSVINPLEGMQLSCEGRRLLGL
jgi:hypothetical protein